MSSIVCVAIFAASLQAAVAGVNLTGRVIDPEGRPIAAARIDIATAAPRVGRGMFCPSCYRDCAKYTETDAEGHFEIKGLDPSLKFHVLFTSPGREAHITELVDPLDGLLKIVLAAASTDLPVERTVRGQLVSAEGVPIRGALVAAGGAKKPGRRWWGRVEGVHPAVSDNQGRFAMLLPESYEGVDLEVAADGYAGTNVDLLPPGEKEHRIVVPVGTSVTGRLQYAGKPVAGLRLAVVQVDRTGGTHFIQAVESITDPQGRFLFQYLPADQPYVIFTPVIGNNSGLVLSTKRFAARGDGESRDLGTLAAMPALRISGRVELPEGASLPAQAKLALDRDRPWDLISIDIADDGRFELGGLPPETYEVRAHVAGLEIDLARVPYQPLGHKSFGVRITESVEALVVPLKAAPAPSPAGRNAANEPPRYLKDVATDQTLSGIVVGLQGDPLAGIEISSWIADDRYLPRRGSNWSHAKTDTNGRFVFRQLPDVAIKLSAYVPNPAGGVIPYPSESRPARNEQDIRIVLDPSLTIDLEDLDPGASVANRPRQKP